MKITCPDKKQIIDAAATSREAKYALEKLFPTVFEQPIKPGEIYYWKMNNDSQSDGWCGIVIGPIGDCLMFANFVRGFVYCKVPMGTTPSELLQYLRCISWPQKESSFIASESLGQPKHFRSWTTK